MFSSHCCCWSLGILPDGGAAWGSAQTGRDQPGDLRVGWGAAGFAGRSDAGDIVAKYLASPDDGRDIDSNGLWVFRERNATQNAKENCTGMGSKIQEYRG